MSNSTQNDMEEIKREIREVREQDKRLEMEKGMQDWEKKLLEIVSRGASESAEYQYEQLHELLADARKEGAEELENKMQKYADEYLDVHQEFTVAEFMNMLATLREDTNV